jgi:hypothetical protein
MLAILTALSLLGAPQESGENLDFFESKIRPVLVEKCYRCHNSVHKKKADLALDYRDGLLSTGVIVPGAPEKSPLIAAIRHEGDQEPMPFKAPKLAKIVLKNFEEWIRMGAPDPRVDKPTAAELERAIDWNAVREERKKWWAFQPIKIASPPSGNDPDWNRTPIDRFIHAGIREAELEPSAIAAPGTLARRLHLILTGLPPKPEVVEAFAANPSDEAYEQLVDELLDSHHYGERWARYWMDWYRYTESHGSQGDPHIPYATRYRDYLIRAINSDVPYDQLVREHLAGDLLERPRIHAELGLNESAIGLGHFRMVPHGFGVTDAYDDQITVTDNQIDVISKAMLGLTVSCARCHNHKFDPISQADYYRFYGIMISSRPAVVNVDAPELQQLHREELAGLKVPIRRKFADWWLSKVDRAMERLDDAELEELPETHPLTGWVALRNLESDDLQRELRDMRRRQEELLARNAQAKSKATFYADLRDQATYEQWFSSGNGLSKNVSPAGSFALAGEGSRVVTGIYPAGVYSHMLSDKHSALLSSVFHLARGEHTLVRALGAEGAIVRYMVRSYPLEHSGLHPTRKPGPVPDWIQLPKYDYWNGERLFYQISTVADRPYLRYGESESDDEDEKRRRDRSWFGLLEIYAGDVKLTEPGAPLVALSDNLDSIVDRSTLLEFYRETLVAALQAWRRGETTDAQARLIDAFVKEGLLPDELDTLPKALRRQVMAYRKLENEIRPPVRAPGVVEGEPWNQPLLARGNYKQEQDPVERGFLEVFDALKSGKKTYSNTASGRRELAEDILSEHNPLTSRVLVNRLWHHVFGRGLVATTDNFGRLGKEPTHPELLDYLAADFRQHGWSIKRAVKQMVMSRTFRSASSAPAANLGKDAENLKLAYYRPRRLDAEAILDTIRFVATNEVGKRAVYEEVKRNSLNRFLATFNFPIPISTVGVRDLTDVPAQSLALMNGEITQDAAQRWSKRITSNPALKTDRQRIDRLFMQAFSRHPTEAALEACLAYLEAAVRDGNFQELVAERDGLNRAMERLHKQRDELIEPVRSELRAETDRRIAAGDIQKPRDLRPISHWDFDKDARDLIGNLHGEVIGRAKIEEGALVLDGGCVFTTPLSQSLREKSLEVVVQLDSLDQRGGGAMTVQNLEGDVFDSIVYAEKNEQQWLAGSDHHHRTRPFPGAAYENDAADQPVRMIIVYAADGSIAAYRNGERYGQPYRGSKPIQFEASESLVTFGLRHGTAPQGGRMLIGRIFDARLYDHALTHDDVVAIEADRPTGFISAEKIKAALSANDRRRLENWDAELVRLEEKAERLDREISRREELRDRASDPYFRITHALLNSKELIYVY